MTHTLINYVIYLIAVSKGVVEDEVPRVPGQLCVQAAFPPWAHWDAGLSRYLTTFSFSPAPCLRSGQQPEPQEITGSALPGGMAGLAGSTYELRTLLAFYVRPHESGATATNDSKAWWPAFRQICFPFLDYISQPPRQIVGPNDQVLARRLWWM